MPKLVVNNTLAQTYIAEDEVGATKQLSFQDI